MASSDGTKGGARIEWRDWGAAAFEEARASSRPVLLTGTATWSADARALDERVLSDPQLIELTREALVPIRFDADRLPHVRDRYNSGGWPITALLTPDGDLLWAGRPADAGPLREMAAQAVDAWRSRREEIELELSRRQLAGSSSRARSTGGMVRREAADDVLTAAQAMFDTRNGGFGDSFKIITPDIVELLLIEARALDNPDWLEMATRTLDGMLAGAVYDAERGGFFRLARQADWTDPSTEKLLESNAWALRAFGLAGHVMQRTDWREVAEHTVAWAESTLALPDGLWAGSQAADDAWYASGSGDPPPIDRTVYTDASAQWIAALAEVGGRLGHDGWVKRAADALKVLLDTMRADDGLLHHFRAEGDEPECAGLLSDIAEAARACHAVAQATGDMDWVARASSLASAMLEHFWADDGGFRDIAPSVPDIAGLRHAARPFETNAAAASVLVDLSVLDGGRTWRASAEQSLAVLSPLAGRYGVAAAGFALAVEHHFEPPRSFVVVGSGDAADDLRRAALGVPIVDRQVWSLAEGGAVGGRSFKLLDAPAVYACSRRRCSAPIVSPEELSSAAASAR